MALVPLSRERAPCRVPQDKTATRTSPQLRRFKMTPVHWFMESNKNVTAEVVERLHKLVSEVFTATDK